ncbi:GNAT family N-acetyltransferase [uncultured Psychroserpens sp.]|uniref:GNAT family N-acetyltransferase n=1 Tax=uncultured Psychroserpens sp. TaxID=255436 RepID=UPI002628879D|nr:GNAT family N-acetyltransferase [uncultured Psychroserpens sp.]
MQKYSVQKYQPKLKKQWDEFIANSKNATFLFQRDFMDYHQDRFDDYSLMVYNNHSLFAVLPANRNDNQIYSHQGLSYGGFLLKTDSKFQDVLNAFKTCLMYLSEHQIENFELKLLPKIYCKLPSDEIDYLLFKTQAQISRRDISAVIDLKNPLKINSSNRKRNLKKAKSNHIEVKEVDTFKAFFDAILIPNLKERYETLPTHSIEEITLLKEKFPKQIRQFNAYYNAEVIAGVTIFETKNVAHAQYISTMNSKKDLAGLDAIFDKLINTVFNNKHYFSFGISNENKGQQINQGLLKWKESFGARAVVHDFYKINTKNYNFLNDVMI